MKKIYFENNNNELSSYDFISNQLGSLGNYKSLHNLSKINIFVGPNNSGKSRMMRGVALQKQYFFEPADIDIREISSLIADFKAAIGAVFPSKNIIDYGGLKLEMTDLVDVNFIKSGDIILKNIQDRITKIKSFKDAAPQSITTRNGAVSANHDKIIRDLKKIAVEYSEKIQRFPVNKNFKKIYIPILRGLRSLSQSDKNEYKTRTVVDYFKNENENGVEVFTGLELYDLNKKMSQGNHAERNNLRSFIQFISKEFFEGQNVELISKDDGILWIKIGSETEQPVHNLGDGIQSIIILTFPLFSYRNQDVLIFIEEPEMLIHPGLQRVLLNCFRREGFEKFQYFLTTHSNHFLDLTLDVGEISVYTISKKTNTTQNNERLPFFVVENVSNDSENILGMLGVRNSSVFLSNCTIWVEGVTDRLYIKHFFDIYQKEKANQGLPVFKEDVNFSFVEYGGNNITHWSFLDEPENSTINVKRLCGKLFLVTDMDGENKISRHEKLKQNLGDDGYFCLTCKEIENLIPKKALVSVLRDYEKIDTLPNENFTEKDYEKEYIGNFIEKTVLQDQKKRDGRYAEDSGTITKKSVFCKKILVHINNYSDLSENAILLCEKIYNFISMNNK